MAKSNNQTGQHLTNIILVLLWTILTSLTIVWIFAGGGFEAWIVLIGEIALPLVFWVRSKFTENIDPFELEKNIRLMLHRLYGHLQKESGIRDFVPLHLIQSGSRYQIKTIENAFDQLNHFTITGKAGSGKTTLLQRLALQVTSKSLGDETIQQIPVWLNLCEWEDGQPLEVFIRNQWVDIERPLKIIAQYNSIVFLDGLDELGGKSQKKVQQLNKWLQGSLSPNKVIGSCRSYQAPFLDIDMQTVEVADELTDAQIYVFAHKYLESSAAEIFLTLLMLETPSQDELMALETQHSKEVLAPDSAHLIMIHEILNTQFNLEELKALCFNLNVDYDNLGGEVKVNKTRELVLVLNRNGSFSNLEKEISKLRSQVVLSHLTQVPTKAESPTNLQAISDRYTNGKDIKLLLKVITETNHRYTDEVSYYENIYQPFTKNPFQLTILFKYFQNYLDQESLPLNLGRVTDTIIRAIWNREQTRRVKAWIPYQAMTVVLAEFSYSRMSYSYEIDCQTQKGFHLTHAAYTLNNSFERVRYHQQSNYKKWMLLGLKLITFPIWFPFIVLKILIRSMADFAIHLAYRLRLWRIESLLAKSRRRQKDAREKATIQQAQPLLNTLVSAGILQLVEETSSYGTSHNQCVHFTDARFSDYYAAHSFMGIDPQPLFIDGLFGGRYDARWRRMNSRWDRVFIALSGLVDNPNELISELASISKDNEVNQYEYDKSKPNDLYLAAKCILSLGSNSVETAFLNTLANCLVDTMQDIQNAGELRSVHYARAVYFLGYFGDTFHINSTIEALQPYDFYQEALKEVIVLYGKDSRYQKPVVDSLLDELEHRIQDKDGGSANKKTIQFIVRALGEIGNEHTRVRLQVLLSKIEPANKVLYGSFLVALTRLGEQQAEEKFLQFLISGDGKSVGEYFQTWRDAADLGIAIIPKLVNILYQHDNPADGFIRTMTMIGRQAVPVLIQQLEASKNKPAFDPILPYVQATLIDALAKLGDVRALEVIQTFLDEPDTIPNVYAVTTLVNSLAEIGDSPVLEIVRKFLNNLDLVSDADSLDLFLESLHEIVSDPVEEIVHIHTLSSISDSFEVANFIVSLMGTGNQKVLGITRTFLNQTDLFSDLSALNEFINALYEIKNEHVFLLVQLYYNQITSVACKSAINAVSLFPENFDATHLFPLLISKSPVVRSLTAGALGKCGDDRAARPLVDMLNDDAKVHHHYGFGSTETVCEFVADALREINTPETNSIAFDWYKNRLLNTPKTSREAKHAHLGLVNMSTNKAWEIINQWESDE